jgi:flagellar protein FliO/FliZ
MTALGPAVPTATGSIAQLTLSLLLIVGLIFGLAWLIKRLRVVAPRGTGNFAVEGQLALGPRERILLVRVGDAQVLVGVGAAGMVSLTPLSKHIELQMPAPAPDFASRLRELMTRDGKH